MRVIQFELDGIPLLEDFQENFIVCTGTHDNDTILGWFESLPESSSNKNILTKKKLLRFFRCTKDDIHWEIISYALSTSSKIVIIPIQDILGESSSSRFNTPGTLSPDNWSWRMDKNVPTKSIKKKLFELSRLHKRNSSIINNSIGDKLESWR